MSVGTLMKHNECTMCGECRVAGGWRRRRTSSLRLFMWAGSASLTKASRIAFTLACFSSSEAKVCLRGKHPRECKGNSSQGHRHYHYHHHQQQSQR